jgi:AcrR family transcriptional regulator
MIELLHTAPYGRPSTYGSVCIVSIERRPRLSRDDWTAEAMVALAESGLSAVAIEPLAARLGATKGSGYWHFANRAALVDATLLRWEREYTEQVITHTAQHDEPADRLRHLFHTVIRMTGPQSVELALLAAASDPSVEPVLRRVTERRVAYLTQLFTELHLDKYRARQRALLAYTTYLGHAQLARTAPSELPTRRHLDAYLDSTVALITARRD